MVLLKPARVLVAAALAAGSAGLMAHLTRHQAPATRTRTGSSSAPAHSTASPSPPVAGTPVPAAAPPPDLRLPEQRDPPADPHARPSFVYGALDGDACTRELSRRGIAFTPAQAAGAPGVERPLRLAGPLHGVTIVGVGLAKQKGGSIFEIADCRLALALDDFAALLARRGIVQVEHFCIHRPGPHPSNAKAAAVPNGKPVPAAKPGPAPKSKPEPKPVAKKPPPPSGKPSQHELGLAIDVSAFVKSDGTRLEVKRDWAGALGAPPCQPVANEADAAAELRAIVCEARAKGLFTVMLTPNANVAHADHLHLDITRDATWTLLE